MSVLRARADDAESQPPEPSLRGSGEERKHVTIVFADVAGSTALADRLDPEALRDVMQRYFDAMRAEIEAEGGTVEKFIGDAVMAVFGVPVARTRTTPPGRCVRPMPWVAAWRRSTPD